MLRLRESVDEEESCLAAVWWAEDRGRVTIEADDSTCDRSKEQGKRGEESYHGQVDELDMITIMVCDD